MKPKFKKEFKKQIRLAIAAAVGFIIAFAWRDFVLQLSEKFISRIILLMPITSSFVSAILITLFGVILILITSKLIK